MTKTPVASTATKKNEATRAGRMIGSVTLSAVAKVPRPFMYDASSREGSMFLSADEMNRYAYGM